MANYMAEVAKMLGVELDEEFEIQFESPFHTSAMFTDDRFQITNADVNIPIPYWPEAILHSLLRGNLTIKRKPWKPKCGEVFWYVDCYANVKHQQWVSWDCENFYKIGNCYRTCDEAKASRDKWSRFYASDEVLEV